MRIRRSKILTTLAAIILWTNLSSAAMTPAEIMRLADRARGNIEGVQWKVHIHSIEKGREQHRKLDVKARDFDFLAILTAPAKVKRHKLLMVDHNMWFAKPGIRKPVPVSSRQKLIGGASYGDIAATNYANDYEAKLIKIESVNGEPSYLFDLKALTKKATYDRIRYWISQKRLVGVKAEYYTISGKLFKWASFRYDNKIQLDAGPSPFISEMTIYDGLIKENITTMKFSRPKVVRVPPSALDLNLLMMK